MYLHTSRTPNRDLRRAVTGIFLAILVFTTIFIAGVGYYLFESQESLVAEQAARAKQGSVQEAGSESLIAVASQPTSGPFAGWLTVDAYNSGGVPITITAVFVTTPSGKALSASTTSSQSQFLVAPPDLNVTLPLSLAPGAGTGSLAGCGSTIGCHIGINTAACPSCQAILNSGGTVYLNLLTARGNTFSAPFPRPVSTVTSTSTYLATVSATSTSTTVISTIQATTSVTSATTMGGFVAGTNSLLLSMQACAGSTSTPFGTTCTTAPAVYLNQEVILNINVMNFANIAMSVYVDFQSVGTNGAAVSGASPDACTGGQTSAQVIPASSSATFTCTFSVTDQGPTGGTVTLIGYAVGTYQVLPAPPVEITSAEVLSNPIQVGNPESFVTGPLVPVSFKYMSSTQSSPIAATVISAGSNDEVIFQAVVENTANTSLTILEYSFLLNARIRQEENYYIVQSVPTWTSPLSAYTCTLGTSNAPTGTTTTVTSTSTTTSTGTLSTTTITTTLPVTSTTTVVSGTHTTTSTTTITSTRTTTSTSTPVTTTITTTTPVGESSCITVATGAKVTLDLAACAAGTADWMWEQADSGNSYSTCSGKNDSGLNPPEAVTMILIIVYDVYSHGAWQDQAEALPLQGTYFTK